MNKITGLAGTLAVALSVVAGIIAIPGGISTALVLVILGIIVGMTTPQDAAVRIYVAVLTFPVVAAALGNFPTIGENLTAIFSNLGLAAAGIAATLMACRVYTMAKDGITGLTAKD